MAYTAAVTLTDRKPRPIGDGLYILRGTVNVTSYNSTQAEITDITKYFRDTGGPVVILDGASDEGYLVAWDTTAKAVKSWDHLDSSVGETADDTDIGAVAFIAYGKSAS